MRHVLRELLPYPLRSQILSGLCDVALVVGADQVAKGMFAPVPGDRPNDVDWLRFD